ncbi:hypothetical protein [Streptomyces sp. KR80]|uniref:hypothetical protein n=1 Tax=Streptomyces sp. KR80 TaxID=3457426 RepID=UPI003FD3FA2B
MRSARVVATTAAAAAVVGLAAPVAVASTPANVDPHRVHPGQTVWISDDGYCDIREGTTAYSGAFGSVPLTPRGDRLVGSARVLWHARGKHSVVIRCGDGERLFGRLQVGPTRGSRAGEGGGTGKVNNAELVGGAALVVLAVGGGVVVLRRRRKGST